MSRAFVRANRRSPLPDSIRSSDQVLGRLALVRSAKPVVQCCGICSDKRFTVASGMTANSKRFTKDWRVGARSRSPKLPRPENCWSESSSCCVMKLITVSSSGVARQLEYPQCLKVWNDRFLIGLRICFVQTRQQRNQHHGFTTDHKNQFSCPNRWMSRATHCQNKKAQLENFSDDFDSLIVTLKILNFLWESPASWYAVTSSDVKALLFPPTSSVKRLNCSLFRFFVFKPLKYTALIYVQSSVI